MHARIALAIVTAVFATSMLATCPAALAEVNREACKTLLSPNLADSGQKPPVRNLSADQLARGTLERACLKSYSDGFPGGEEAFLKADSETLRKDLDHVDGLFTQYAAAGNFAKGAGNEPDQHRKTHIELGWDREQVLLWGNFYYIRRLFEEGKFKQVLVEVTRVRKTFSLEVRPLASWDKLEEATYFSKQSLRNLISTMDYRAQAKLPTTTTARVILADDFIAKRDALKPFFKMTGDPTREMLKPYCQNSSSK
jgi:hypothetical protein